MGVTGLWRLIEPAGKPVPVETLENKVLAVDISIWLHQMVKGYQDAKGAPLPNAHLMGLFQRLCKLLYFRIKPVFVFDGGFPDLKNETIAKRQNHKAKYNSESERIRREITLLLSKKTAIGSLLGKQISPKKSNAVSSNDPDDIFKLPALPQKDESESESDEDESSSSSVADLHSIDLESESFKQLPMKEKYELLIELKETRKMNSWGKLHELPKKSDSFSDFQMQRLLKRRKVQEHLEETEKEMGSTGMSICELETLLNEEGIDTKIESLPSRRIASDNNTRFLLINNVKQALADAKKKKEAIENPSSSKTESNPVTEDKINELEDDLQKAIKMSLECVDDHETSACTSKTDDSWTSMMTDSDVYSTDSEEEDGYEQPSLSTAKAYIMQYCDFTHKAINKIVAPKVGKTKSKVSSINDILNEINHEKSIVADEVEVSSDDENGFQNAGNDFDIDKIKKESGNDDSPIALNTSEKHSTDSSQNAVLHVENSKNINITLDICGNSFQNPGNDFEICEMEKQSSIDDSTIAVNSAKKISTDATQNSVIHVENSENSIITLDTSNDEEFGQSVQNESKINNHENSSVESLSSSDGEFEEVPSEEIKNTKVVEVTLNVGNAPVDDIFADVFKPPLKSECSNIDTKKTEVSNNKVEPVTKNVEVTDEIKNTVKTPNIDNKEVSQPKTKDEINKDATLVASSPNQKVFNDTQIEQRTKSVTNHVPNLPKEPISNERLQSMAEQIDNSEQDLLKEKGRLDRIGRNITQEMTKEAQELLQLFGVPYIIAPMEAEAQCAFLEIVNLTDGTITDDSDIWLFGGRTVYKNFFNQKKHVLQFLSERIEKSFNLTREQLILLALLVGSDYTTGVAGVGPVTALEILASFPFNKKLLEKETSKHAQYAQIITGLNEFKQWVRAGKRTDNANLKKKLRNVKLTDDFPSVRVVQAYMEPNIEKNEEKFTWGEIDLTVLRDYTKAKFGWSQNKLDEIMKPVMKRIQERRSQKTVQDYFKRKIEFQSLEDQMSKRVKVAVQKMGPDESAHTEIVEELKEKSKPKARKRKVNKNYSEVESNTNSNPFEAGPSNAKVRTKSNATEDLSTPSVKIVTEVIDEKSEIDIRVIKSDRYQEIIPQREKDKQSLLQNKMKAIELFRKTTIDRKRQIKKRKAIKPKDKAELSESSDSN